jgi:acylphosphatase
MDTIHLEIRGRVQGVGFRWFIVQKAEQLELAGWVRNRSDGCVEIAAAGPIDSLRKLESAARTGPRGARVEEVRELPPVAADSLRQPFGIAR